METRKLLENKNMMVEISKRSIEEWNAKVDEIDPCLGTEHSVSPMRVVLAEALQARRANHPYLGYVSFL